jgi:hypothetical protein
MDRNKVLEEEHGKRVKMFREFVEAFKKRGPTEFPSLSFLDAIDDPEVITFRYLGEKLRIRHRFEVSEEDRSQMRTAEKPEKVAGAVWSKLELLEPREHMDKDVLLASLGVKADGEVTLVEPHPHDRQGHLIDVSRIGEKPEKAFCELIRLWQTTKKSDTEK